MDFTGKQEKLGKVSNEGGQDVVSQANNNDLLATRQFRDLYART